LLSDPGSHLGTRTKSYECYFYTSFATIAIIKDVITRSIAITIALDCCLN